MSSQQVRRPSPAPTPPAHAAHDGVAARVSLRSMSMPMRVLRLMLGATFLYAGIYKALDATFLDPKSSGYIGVQIGAFAQNSPISFLLTRMEEHAALVGWGTMLLEFAIGIAVLAGVWLFPAAIAGLGLSLSLWLSSSWHVTPYFLASDPAYVAMWIAFGLGVYPQRGLVTEAQTLMGRRSLLQLGGVGALSIMGAVILKPFASGSAKTVAASASPTTGSAATSSSTVTAGGSSGGTAIAKLADLPIGGAVNFTAADGSPAVCVRLAQNSVAAFSAICTHQGCTVQYDSGSKELLCPCHGAVYDPAHHAAVVGGPAPAPLQEYKASIRGNEVIVA